MLWAMVWLQQSHEPPSHLKLAACLGAWFVREADWLGWARVLHALSLAALIWSSAMRDKRLRCWIGSRCMPRNRGVPPVLFMVDSRCQRIHWLVLMGPDEGWWRLMKVNEGYWEMDYRASYRENKVKTSSSFYKEACRSETIEDLFHPVSVASLATKAT